jgi:hypothetical protein
MPALVAVITLLRILWLVFDCEYTLIEDEAKYWTWAQRLDWSYYTKGPGVAWVIAASTALFSDVEWAVRLPAPLAGAIGALACGLLARDATHDHRVAFVAAGLYAIAPAYAITGVLITIDGPFLACWAVAAFAAHRALRSDEPRWWLLVGVALAVGFLFKYTILFLVPSLLWALARFHRAPHSQASPRRHTPWLLAAATLAALGLLPVLIWNAQHDWVTVRHLLGHAGLPGGDINTTFNTTTPEPLLKPLSTLEYLLLLLVTAGPIIPLVVLGRLLRRWDPTPSAPFLIACAAPVLLFYLALSLIAHTEGNWPIAGFVTLIPLAALAVIRGVQHNVFPIRFFWGAALVIGIGTWAGFAGMPYLAAHTPLGSVVPVHRLTGLREHADHVQRALDNLRHSTDLEPFLLCEHYGRAAQLWYYLPHHPVVYCAQGLVGGRTDQWDVWPDTNLARPEVIATLAGRPALIMGGRPDQWDWAFLSVTDIGPLPAEPKDSRTTYVGHHVLGFDSGAPAVARAPGALEARRAAAPALTPAVLPPPDLPAPTIPPP